MIYLTENEAYKLWQATERSWQSLYNLLYKDYYEGHKIGLDNNLVYKLLIIAGNLEEHQMAFPQTSDQFYKILNKQLELI